VVSKFSVIDTSSSSSVDRWTQVVDLYVQSVVYHSEYRTIRIQLSTYLWYESI